MSGYVKQTWEDYPLETSPINAERLNHMEEGILRGSEGYDRAESIRPYSPNQEVRAIYDYIFPIHKLYTMQTNESGVNVKSDDYVSFLAESGLIQLEAFYNAFADISGDEYAVPLTPYQASSSSNLTFKYTSGGQEYSYELDTDSIYIAKYVVNHGKGIPSKVPAGTKPLWVNVYGAGNGLSREKYTDFDNADRSVINVKYMAGSEQQVEYLWVSLISSNLYFAVAMYTEGGTTYVVPFAYNTSSHKIFTTEYIGKRIDSDWRYYFIMSFTYDENDIPSPSPGGDDTETFDCRFSSYGSNINIYYYDYSDNTYKLYTPDTLSGPPSMTYSPYQPSSYEAVDKKMPNKVTIEFKDSTSLSNEAIYMDSNIASAGDDGSLDFLIADISSNEKLVLAHADGGYGYSVFIINTNTHTYYTGGKIYDNGYVQSFSVEAKSNPNYAVIRNAITDHTTFSSKRIQAALSKLDPSILEDLQAQIDAIPGEKAITYPNESSFNTPWSNGCFGYLDSNDEYVSYTSSDDRLLQYAHFNGDNKVYEEHWTPETLSILFGDLQITDGVVSVDTSYAGPVDPESTGITHVFSVPIPNQSNKYLVLGIPIGGDYEDGYIGIIDTVNHTVTSAPPGDVWSITNFEITYEK